MDNFQSCVINSYVLNFWSGYSLSNSVTSALITLNCKWFLISKYLGEKVNILERVKILLQNNCPNLKRIFFFSLAHLISFMWDITLPGRVFQQCFPKSCLKVNAKFSLQFLPAVASVRFLHIEKLVGHKD